MNRRCDSSAKSGFTLLEVLIASAILSALIIIALDGLFIAQKTLTWSNFVVDLERRADGELSRVTNELAAANAVYVSTDCRTLCFQIPIDFDADGDYVDDSGNIEYGYHLQGVTPVLANDPLGWSVVYQFVPTGTLDETADKVDYNGDKDYGDTFITGRIDMAILDSVETTAFRALTVPQADNFDITTATTVKYVQGIDGVMLRTDGNLDINEDGTTDPIVQQVDTNGTPSASGNRMLVNIWMAGKDSDGHAKVKNVTTTINLRNLN